MKMSPFLLLAGLALMAGKCQNQHTNGNNTQQMDQKQNNPKHSNKLINESSPYLLQHAHNPVDWYPWGEEALNRAKEENKPMIISIGYSACHWCHVMERESFEDEEVARLMNENFICIKVDREERPDIDHIYMDAVQMIIGQGGWPLNCFALPDGKPFYGGTYYPKKNWMTLLENVLKEYESNPADIEAYSNKLMERLKGTENLEKNGADYETQKLLDLTAEKWKTLFDNTEGGMEREPKFPLPNNYSFLLDYGSLAEKDSVVQHVELTLDKMAFGGIYDQLGGGFARYSTDALWKVPHFEKMLYDNAQMVSLYAKAYRRYGKTLYGEVVKETLAFVSNELTDKSGCFYAALDADSEGEEGTYYVWREEELKEILGGDFEFAAALYNVRKQAVWEDGKYVLHRVLTDQELMERFDIEKSDLVRRIGDVKSRLLKVRNKRERPGLDDKILTSWNALMISAYAEAYRSFGEENYLQCAEKAALFIWKKQYDEKSGRLYHTYKNGKSSVDGFLEDYALVAAAFIDLYQVTFDEQWLQRANRLAQFTLKNFKNPTNGLFYFAPESGELVTRHMELTDNVIPSSNSVLAQVLFTLGTLFDNPDYLNTSRQMLDNVAPFMAEYGSSYSNWGLLMLRHSYSYREVAVSGKEAIEKAIGLQAHYLPNTLFLGSSAESQLPLLEMKYVPEKTMFYVCENKACMVPVEKVDEALKQLAR